MIREGRLRDWLELLSFDVGSATRYCHTLPLERFKQLRLLPREELAQKWLPMSSGGYLVRAQKRVHPLTPVRMWRRPARLRVVGGLVEPTTRSPLSRVSTLQTRPRAPRALMQDVQAFTDGACRGNPGPGGWGVVLRAGAREKELCGGELHTTNNRMELTAAIEALKALKKPCRVALYTDSTYVRSGITEWLPAWRARGWRTADKKPVKNQDLWADAVGARGASRSRVALGQRTLGPSGERARGRARESRPRRDARASPAARPERDVAARVCRDATSQPSNREG